MTLDEVESIQRQALMSVLEPNMEDFIRKICRWYSRAFYTPLHLVERMPLDYVAKHYFEYYYENMDDEDQDGALEYLSMSEEERVNKKRKEEEDLKNFNEEAVKEEFEKKKKKNRTRFISELKNVKPLRAETEKREPVVKSLIKDEQIEDEEVKIVFTDKDVGID